MTDEKAQDIYTKKSFTDGLKPFLVRPVIVMMLLGFACGLPLSLIFDTLSVWLRDVGLSLEVIGFFSLATFSYSLKFVWAPLVDRLAIPVLTQVLGHRRSWILVAQIAIIFGLMTISGLNPKDHLGLMAAVAVFIGFAGATQDIVVDAWRIETAQTMTQGQAVMATASAWGARVAPFVSGIVPLLLADSLGWGFAYGLMAAFMGLGLIGVALAPKEAVHKIRTIDYRGLAAHPLTERLEWALRLVVIIISVSLMGCGLTGKMDLFKPVFAPWDSDLSAYAVINSLWTSKTSGISLQFAAVIFGLGLMLAICLPLPGTPTRPGIYLKQTFVEPLADFFKRYENLALLIIVTLCVYRVSDFLLNINGAFYLDLGFDKATIAEVRKVFGVIMTILGVTVAGFIMTRFGLKASLIFGAIVGALSNLAYAWLATQGDNVLAFCLTLGVDNLSGGIAGTVLIAYLSSLISKGYAAPQYALFTSLYALPGKLLASQSGRIVESIARDKTIVQSLPQDWFSQLPTTAFAKPADILSVSREALASGYILFFIYTAAIGLFAIAFSIWLVRAQTFMGQTPLDDQETPARTS
jgi:MFS transporter, PAT family, beta-lactamase induction signal transducer AmpG